MLVSKGNFTINLPTHPLCLTLGGDQNHFVVQFNAFFVSQKTWNHQLGSVTNRVHSRVLHNKSLVANKQSLQRRNDLSQVALVSRVVVKPLSVHDIVQSHKVVIFRKRTRTNSSKLLHVSSNSQKHTKMHTQSSHIGTSLAGSPENTQTTLVVELKELRVVNGSHSQLSLDSRNQRRSLEQCTGQTIKQPVTFGSRVPECPVFSVLKILFTQATTSCEEGFDGLSKLITPEEM
ncbi:hypothetical protein OGAPHI_003617 [Ogataea philodendri]|uniref:Uncharacterized protein n=1 Tax=Ogataea philodendri TaxID=1378263 RepID=A0A9P8T400_9ASCO|nr:uncharacterized protein OGAPHI_003617 [Ogataea philodendri]KAH3665433.1 hypothetical protein OGAPHI_003617 [Ogataea philodendri]